MSGQSSGQIHKTIPPFFYGYIVVGVAVVIMLFVFGTVHTFGVFFKPISTEFGWTRGTISGAFSLSAIIAGVLGIFMGWLNDRFGPRFVLSLCGFFMGLGYLLMSQTSSVWEFYLFYGILLGIGMAGTFVPLSSTVARWFAKRRSMMTGIVTAGEGLGTLLFPPLAALLVQTYEWRVSYLILGAIVLIVVATAAQFLKRDPSDKGQYVDGGSDAEQPEMELADPAFSLGEVVSTKQFWLVCSVLFSIGFCVLAIVVHIIPHATDSGISVSTAANILASIGGFGIVGRLVLGGVADRIGIKRVLVMGLILMSVSLLWLLQSGELWEFYLFAIIFGLSSGGISTLGSPLVAELFGLKSHGLIYGVSDLGFTVGAAMGPLVTGYIFDSTGVYTLAFLVCAGLGIVAIILTGTLTPTNKHGVSLG